MCLGCGWGWGVQCSHRYSWMAVDPSIILLVVFGVSLRCLCLTVCTTRHSSSPAHPHQPQCILQGIALATFDYERLSQQAVARLRVMTDADAIVDEGAALFVTKSRASTLSYNPNVSARQLLQRTRYGGIGGTYLRERGHSCPSPHTPGVC